MRLLLLSVTMIAGLLSVAGCPPPPPWNLPGVNTQPSADAGPDLNRRSGDTVILDASGSQDPDEDPLTYMWTQTSGPATVQISGRNSAQASFVPTVPGTYEFSVTVSDGRGGSDSATVRVFVEGDEIPPGAPIGPAPPPPDDVPGDGRAAGRIESTFAGDDEGWRVLGGAFPGETRPAWQAGVISAQGSGEWYWIAPAKFLGDLSAAYGQRLSIEWSTSTSCRDSGDYRGFVVLTGGGVAIAWGDRPRQPNVPWTTYSVVLDETATWYVAGTNLRASDAQIQAVLSNLEKLEIFGQNENCRGTTQLRRVSIALWE